MTKKQIDTLVQASYTKDKLDEAKVTKITKMLSRKDLKSYIRGLKLEEKRRNIYVALPSAKIYNTAKATLEEIFGNKPIIVREDPSLLVGMNVTDNDMEYDMSLKSRLE